MALAPRASEVADREVGFLFVRWRIPWSVAEQNGKYCVVKEGESSPVACHATQDEAAAQVKALYANEAASSKVAFDQFGKMELGRPIRLLPEGRWYRGSRILDLTKERLEEIASNFAKGLPRFRVGLNLDHEDKGKVGDVKSVAYLPEGLNGPGVYITDYEMSARAIKAIEEDGYDGVSAEVVWSLNDGAKYQDPETGQEYDNVLTGVALTPKPFFGHNHVSLYSEEANVTDKVKTMLNDALSLLGREKETPKEVIVTEELKVSPGTEKLQADLVAANGRAEKLEAELKTEKMAQRKAALQTEAKSYSAISVKIDEYVDRFVALEDKDPKLAEWFRAQFVGFDTAAKVSGATDEKGSDQTSDKSEADQFLAAVDGILKEEFRGDVKKYSDAMKIAQSKHPALAQAYAVRLTS